MWCTPHHLLLCSEDIFKEIDILCGLNHENVVFLKEYFEEGNKARNAHRALHVQAQCAAPPCPPLPRIPLLYTPCMGSTH